MPKHFTREDCSRWSPSWLGKRGSMEVKIPRVDLAKAAKEIFSGDGFGTESEKKSEN